MNPRLVTSLILSSCCLGSQCKGVIFSCAGVVPKSQDYKSAPHIFSPNADLYCISPLQAGCPVFSSEVLPGSVWKAIFCNCTYIAHVPYISWLHICIIYGHRISGDGWYAHVGRNSRPFLSKVAHIRAKEAEKSRKTQRRKAFSKKQWEIYGKK